MEDEKLVVVIVDDSRAFDSSQVRDPDIEASLEDRVPGGLGLFLVHEMMDGVEYRRMDGCNVVTLTKSTALKVQRIGVWSPGVPVRRRGIGAGVPVAA